MPETQAAESLPGILAEIVASKSEEVEGLLPRARLLEREAEGAAPPRDFAGALARGGSVSLIAECKRRSPGAGPIRPGLDPVVLCRAYQDAGAAALSVLTDEPFFGGRLSDLSSVRSAVDVPVLRKDFTLHPVQVTEARAAGADAVLLIVRILDDPTLGALLRHTEALGMTALVEAHDADEVRRALAAGASVLGINNRDLARFTTDVDTTLRLLDEVSDDVVVVSESGIRAREDVERLGAAGVDAVLVGETLLRASDPGAAAAELSGVPHSPRSGVVPAGPSPEA